MAQGNEAAAETPPDEALDPRPRTMRHVLGRSESWVRIFEALDRILHVPCPVLLSGPHGSGKHTCARALYETAGSTGNFVVVDASCTELPEPHGSSRARNRIPRIRRCSASSDPQSWLTLAAGGTLFVSEVSALPASAQVQLTDALQSDASAGCRLIGATKHSLDSLLLQRSLRPDFFYRLNVMSLTLPPLRDRSNDILELAETFLLRAQGRPGGPRRFSPTAAQLLLSYGWPGNMSELRSAVEHSAAVSTGRSIQPADLPPHVKTVGEAPRRSLMLPETGLDLRRTLETLENDLVQQALERTGWNKQRAARLLGLNRTTLVEMLKRKRLDRSRLAP